MIGFAEYDQFDGIGLAELVREKKISGIEICEAAVKRAENLNPTINAINFTLFDFAMETARQLKPDAPFAYVPFLLKDVHHALKGFPMSSGSRLLRGFTPQHDAEIVSRFKKAGVIILGKTNTPEFKLAYITEPKAFGPTRNPWNTKYSSGGSSGGAAAAVAARIVPLASATDEGGSIRVPSSYCGVFGLKPSRGRNPVGPDFGQEWDGMSTSHVITRSVRDSAAMLDMISGPESGMPYGILGSPQACGFLEALKHPLRPLRICFHTRPAYGRQVHPECVQAVENTCKLLQNLGHVVEEARPDFTEEEAALAYIIVLIGNAGAHVDKLIQAYGRSNVRDKIELKNFALYSVAQNLKTIDFIHAKRRWRKLGADLDRCLNEYDLMLTPTLGEPPVKVGSQEPGKFDEFSMRLLCSWLGKLILGSRKLTRQILEEMVHKTMQGQLPFTLIANVTGRPAMSVPLHWTEQGLPCGVQFIGGYGREDLLLQLAAQLEQARPWMAKKPPWV